MERLQVKIFQDASQSGRGYEADACLTPQVLMLVGATVVDLLHSARAKSFTLTQRFRSPASLPRRRAHIGAWRQARSKFENYSFEIDPAVPAHSRPLDTRFLISASIKNL
ncbi:MAG: hypothetical protein Q7S85_09465 [Rugosibacter sp.]|nr:hypothetical protein [Rugosibacter sp.]